MDLYRRLAEASGATRCLDYDACPLDGGILVNMDGYSMSGSRLPWASVADWAWKSVVAAASDIAASGGAPRAVSYSIGVPGEEEALEAAVGVGEAARWLGVEVLKSDTNKCGCGDSWIDVAVIGSTSRPIPRSGARPGDYLVQVGYAGYGLVSRLILEGLVDPGDVGDEVLGYTRRPRPPIVMGPSLAGCGVTAASDNSDGLGFTVKSIADASGVGVELEDALAHPGVLGVLGSMGMEPLHVYSSWEDYNLVASIPGDGLDCLMDSCRRAGVPCMVIGRIVERPGVRLRGEPLRVEGWSWF